MEIDILGTKYKYIETNDEFNKEFNHKAGVTKFLDKEIFVWREENAEEDTKRLRMHEFIHAFFYESGLIDYATDETLTDFLAVQMPKIVELYNIAYKINGSEGK